MESAEFCWGRLAAASAPAEGRLLRLPMTHLCPAPGIAERPDWGPVRRREILLELRPLRWGKEAIPFFHNDESLSTEKRAFSQMSLETGDNFHKTQKCEYVTQSRGQSGYFKKIALARPT
jgi:hypothetical protein